MDGTGLKLLSIYIKQLKENLASDVLSEHGIENNARRLTYALEFKEHINGDVIVNTLSLKPEDVTLDSFYNTLKGLNLEDYLDD